MRNITKILLSIITLFIIIFATISIFIQTEYVRMFVENEINKSLEFKGLKIELGKLSLYTPINLDVDNVKIYDEVNLISELQNMKIKIVPSLIYKNIILSKITIGKCSIAKQVTGLDKEIDFILSANLKYLYKQGRLEFSNVLEGDFLEEPGSVKISGIYNIIDSKLDVQAIKLETNILKLEGNLLFDQIQKTISSNIRYSSNILSRKELDFNISNNLISGKISIQGDLNNLSIISTGDIKIDFAEDFTLKFPHLFHNSSWTYNGGILKGNIALKQDSIHSKSTLLFDKNIIHLNNFVMEGPEFKVISNLSYDVKSGLLDGMLELYDGNFDVASKYIPSLLGGNGRIQAKLFSKDSKNQSLSLKIEALNLVSDFFGVDELSLNLDSSNLYNSQIDNLDISTKFLRLDDIVINQFNLIAKSRNDKIEISTNIQSQQPYPIELDLVGDVNFTNKKAKLSKFLLTVETNNISNIDNILVDFDNKIQVYATKMSVNKGTLDFDTFWDNEKVSCNANIHNISLNNARSFDLQQFSDVLLKGNINLSGSKDHPILDSKIQIIDFLPEASKERMNIAATVNIDNNNTQIWIGFSEKNNTKALIRTDFKNNFILSPFKYNLKKDEPFEAELDIKSPLNILSIIPNIGGNVYQGKLMGHIKAGNTLNKPYLNGILEFVDTSYSNAQYGINIKDMSGKILAKDSSLILSNMIAKDKAQNEIHVKGEVNILDNYKFDLAANTKKFNPINHSFIEGEYSGVLKFSGDKDHSNIIGNVDLGPLEIQIPDQFKKEIKTLNLVQDKNMDKKNIEENSYKVNLDINLKANNKVFIRGWGLNTEILGELQMKGDFASPIVIGTLKSHHGRYEEFGKNLKVKEGNITFDGPINPSPYLNVIASTNLDKEEIRLVLTGPILNPALHIESTPEMPEDRALSLLLFGKNLEKISTFQAIQLSNSLRRLSGKGGGFDAIEKSRKLLRLNDIKINSDPESSGQNSVAVGKYLTDNVYLELEKGNYDNASKSRIEVELTPHIYIENIIQQEGNATFRLNWRYDY